jgi:1,4-dihydroxy-2-naphthoyl-CoA hydrolase
MASDDLATQLRELASPFTDLLGLRVERASPDEVIATLVVDPARHFQPWGAVHGGVYCTIVETLATYGAQLSAIPAGKLASGIENHTSFLRQVRGGELHARAAAVSRGRQLHLWTVSITDGENRPVAHGSVRLILLDRLPEDKPTA